MNIKDERDEFEKRQTKLIQEIAGSFRSRLAEMGLGADQELVESLVFDISVILDGSREMELEGKPLRPFLTFSDDRKGEHLIGSEYGSWMHEICGGVVEQIFDDESSA